VGVQVKLWNPLTTRAIPERFWGGDSLWRGAISSVSTFTLPLSCLLGQLANQFSRHAVEAVCNKLETRPQTSGQIQNEVHE